MKFPILFAVLAAACVFASNPARADDDKSFFPIMAWNHVPADPAVLKKMHDCGLTVAGFVTADNLDRVHAAGMKAIVNDPRTGNYDWEHVDAAAARKNVESLIA